MGSIEPSTSASPPSIGSGSLVPQESLSGLDGRPSQALVWLALLDPSLVPIATIAQWACRVLSVWSRRMRWRLACC
jgi:hypothetical protein